MSPKALDLPNRSRRFPRVSGDEPPGFFDSIMKSAFSPRERG